MTDTLTEPLGPQRPLARYTQLETDLFCEHCGYNLHGQPVHRDERLGILICRCPECGRVHPAGYRTTATSVWLSRFAAAFLGLWIVVVLSAVVTAGIMFGVVQFAHIDMFTHTVPVAVAGEREVEHKQLVATDATSWGAVYKDTGEPVQGPIMHRVKVREFPRRSRSHVWEWLATLNLFSIGLGFTAGMLLVVFLWHWKRRRYAYVMLVPLISSAFVIANLYLYDQYAWIRDWGVQRSLYYATIQGLAILMGILIGRPVARTLIRMFVPPRPRQHLNFLWHIDGKTPPSATVRTS